MSTLPLPFPTKNFNSWSESCSLSPVYNREDGIASGIDVSFAQALAEFHKSLYSAML